MMQVPTVQPPQAYMTAPPNYNAVKIDINNPQVNTPGVSQSQPMATPAAPVYSSIPTASVYEVPKQSLYEPKQNFNVPPAVKEVPSVPQPVVVPPTINVAPSAQTTAPVPTVVSNPVQNNAPVAPVTATAPTAPAVATPQAVEVKAPETVKPQLDINAFIAKLSSSDYEEQANAMESIAELAQNAPQKATELLDVKVVDSLLNIMQADSSKLTGPTPQQLQIREKIMSGKPVTEAETAEAVKISPMEQSERNKQYAIYTVAILQKLYGSEIEKMDNTVVPLTELPGAAGIVEQVKNNPNPMVRASGIDALSYIQRPEYKQDLKTLFAVAQKDKDVNVQQAATKALEKLAQVADAPMTAPSADAKAPVQKPEQPKA